MGGGSEFQAELLIQFKNMEKYFSSVKNFTDSEYVLEILLSPILGAVESFVCAPKCDPGQLGGVFRGKTHF